MTKLIGRLTIVVALTVSLIGVPAAVQASPGSSADVAVLSVQDGEIGTQAYCDVHPKYSSLTVRSGPGTNYSAVTSISSGQWLYAACSAVYGGNYRCTSTSYLKNTWVQVRYNTWGRYVALDCTIWHRH